MTNPSEKTSKHVNLNLQPLTILLLCLSILVSSQNITELVMANLKQTISKVDVSSSNFSNLQNRLNENLTHLERCAFEDCLTLLDDTIFDLRKAISSLQSSSSIRSHDVKMLLSDAMTNQDTCLEGFGTSDEEDSINSITGIGRTYLLSENLKRRVLDIYNSLGKSLDLLQNIPGNNHSSEVSEVDAEFPSWISEKDQRIIKAPVEITNFNVTVAQDGTGNFTTINDAVSAAPNASETRYIIYIREGRYLENIEIPKKKTMIMFLGDGKNMTYIQSNRSKNEEWSTFQTATVGVRGDGFIARGITFVNTAGPSKNQAVALRSGSAHSAFYQCAFEGYQDTLYVHQAKQFYRECDVYGTVDFIFGNAAVVFQNCSLYARKPDPHQSIMFTAQSRTKANQPTGISIINCTISAAEDLIPVQADFKAYLGRPWRKYSRTVIIKSFIGDLIDPAGWSEWKKTFALKTLYYGEYMNEGPGANLTDRVTWPGYRSIEDEAEANQFTVGPFIDGDIWINSTNIPFDLGL